MSQVGKVKSFSLSTKNKKDLEKQKKQAEDEAAAAAYEQFVATFDSPKPTGKLFVRGSVINPSSGQESSSQQAGKFYKLDKLKELEQQKKPDLNKKNDDKKPSTISEKPPKKKGDIKKKSNLEMFKEELKMIQEEREERQRLRTHPKEKSYKLLVEEENDRNKIGGSHDTGDPNTTNIYMGNLNPKLSENQLCEIFGRYGPLASVKIMWPRTDEERVRNRNCGFVAFMCRIDGERAMKAINGKMVLDYEMRLGWGKAIPIPPNPVYIPPALRELTMPPPPSGLPFNAQVIDEKDKELLQEFGDPQRLYRENKDAFDSLLSRAVVKVVMPTERAILCLIHRVIEFVVREGPMFEALIMSREASNPMFSFLFDNQSPSHVYYRWRLFSILQGDHPSMWRTKEFRMFENGPLWKPPPFNLYQQGMPEELLPKNDEFKSKDEISLNGSDSDSEFNDGKVRSDPKRGQLHEDDREELEDGLRHLTPQRSKIAQLMVFCIEHADACEEIIECITDSLCITDTPLFRKIARLYLLADILHNSSVKVANVSNFRRGFQSKMVPVFESLNQAYNSIEGRLKAEHFKQRVMSCFRAWEDTAIYSADFLIRLQNTFLGIAHNKEKQQVNQTKTLSEDIDGIPIIDPDLDGQEMSMEVNTQESTFSTKFKPSKWETIDPEVVESQAITSKWDKLEKSAAIFPEDDIDGKPMEDGDFFESLVTKKDIKGKSDYASSAALSREVLREIELRVVKYQDELETNVRAGRLHLSDSQSIAQMVEQYRSDLVRKASNNHDLPREQRTLSTSSSTCLSSSSRHSRSRSRSPKARHSKRRK